jgi:ATP-dependent Zn protease
MKKIILFLLMFFISNNSLAYYWPEDTPKWRKTLHSICNDIETVGRTATMVTMLIFFISHLLRNNIFGNNYTTVDSTKQKPDRSKLETFFGGTLPDDILDIALYLENPESFKKSGAKMPKGILMWGPPGTGKTTLARAISQACGCFFISATGTEFETMWLGETERKIRNLFAFARKKQKEKKRPVIVFIDEIDHIAKDRSQRGHSWFSGDVTTLLTELDGFKQNEDIIVIGATNMPERIDPAIKRPDRLDRAIYVGLPDQNARRKILDVHISNRKVTLEAGIDLDRLAQETDGFSGAYIEALINEAAIFAIRDKRTIVKNEDVQTALQKLKQQQQAMENKTAGKPVDLARILEQIDFKLPVKQDQT